MEALYSSAEGYYCEKQKGEALLPLHVVASGAVVGINVKKIPHSRRRSKESKTLSGSDIHGLVQVRFQTDDLSER